MLRPMAAQGGYFTGFFGNQALGGATWGSSSSSSSSTTGGSLEPKSKILQQATLDAIRQRYALGERQTEAGLMRGTARGMARSGQTAGELAQISQDINRDIFALQRNMQDQLARLQGEANERAEARASMSGMWSSKEAFGGRGEGEGEPYQMGTSFTLPRAAQPSQQGFYSTQTRQWFPSREAARTGEAASRAGRLSGETAQAIGGTGLRAIFGGGLMGGVGLGRFF